MPVIATVDATYSEQTYDYLRSIQDINGDARKLQRLTRESTHNEQSRLTQFQTNATTLEGLTIAIMFLMSEPRGRCNAVCGLGVGSWPQDLRADFCIGTTWTVTSRTSDRKRLSTEPRSRMSKRERAD